MRCSFDDYFCDASLPCGLGFWGIGGNGGKNLHPASGWQANPLRKRGLKNRQFL